MWATQYNNDSNSWFGGRSRRSKRGKYMFVADLLNIKTKLPDLLNTFAVLAEFLGGERISISIIEGHTAKKDCCHEPTQPLDHRNNCTSKVLEQVFVPLLIHLGVPKSNIHLRTNQPKLDMDNGHRIDLLASIRNEAMAPLWEDNALNSHGGRSESSDSSERKVGRDVAAIVFFNDIFLRAADALELLHQHVSAGEKSGLETGITTGIDLTGNPPIGQYYDCWVGRTVCLPFPFLHDIAIPD